MQWRDNSDLQKVIYQMQGTCNLFSDKYDNGSKLFISSGKVTSKETQTCLLLIKVTGGKQHEEFVTACSVDPVVFKSTIKKEKSVNFHL